MRPTLVVRWGPAPIRSAKVSAKPPYHDIVAEVLALSITTMSLVMSCQPAPYKWRNGRGTCGAKTSYVNQAKRIASILLVDDDVELLKALTKVLEKAEYEVVPHSDACSAMEFVNSTNKRFDLVITDVFMPGIRGIEFLSAIKGAFPRVPVIVVTAFGDWGQYMDALREGAYEYLSKPLDKSELLAAVARALKNGTAHKADSTASV